MRVSALVALGLTASLPFAFGGAIVREGEVWRVYKGTNTPPVQGSANWTSPLFVHGSWDQLTSGFGYDDGDDASTLSDMDGNYSSIFTRKRMVITNASAITHLTLAMDYDDGFVAYLNGTEVARGNMPAGPVTHNTLSAGFHGSSHENTSHDTFDKEYYALDPSLLFDGTNNVLAISGHNQTLGSSDFSLIAELYTNVSLLRGPFIQMPDTNGVTVAWRTDALTDSVVDYGPDTNYLSGTVSNGTPVHFHDLAITDLLPGTGYFYRVRSGGVTLSEGNAFRTRAAETQDFRFVIYGDFGGGPGSPAISSRINATNADFLVTVGDNIYDNGQPGDHDEFWFQPYAPIMRRSATFPALGNHDSHIQNRRWMATNFFLPTNGPIGSKELVYSYDFGNAHFAVIDSESFDLNVTLVENETKSWLTNDLATTLMPWKFVVLHHPPYTSQGSHPDNGPIKADISPIIELYGVHMVLQGHNHFYERSNPINGVYHITSGGGGRSLYPSISVRKSYSAVLMYTLYSFSVIEIQDKELSLRAYNQNGLQVDNFRLSLGHPFKMDGRLDNPAWLRASNGLALHAAIRSNYLYVAMQDAGEGSDHFIYLADQLRTNRPVNWAKSGTVPQWDAFLADENDNAVNGWYGPSEQALTNYPAYRAITSGLNNNGTNANGVLEGSLDLATHFGAFPQRIYLAGAPYGNGNGGALVASSQVPAGNGSANINTNEFLVVDTRDIALDLPVADAGTNQQMESDAMITLDGSGSTSPSGFALSYAWTQISGPEGLITSPAGITTSFQFTNALAGTNHVILQLTVNDSRFDSTDTVAVAVTAPDLPVADAGSDQAMEWTETNTLDGSASTVAGGFELSYLWTQISGPVAFIASPTGSVTAFYFTNDVPSSTNVIFQLTVNDTRFESTDTVSVAVNVPADPLLDSDGDGLTDLEETTGVDEPATYANPDGQTSNPLIPDTDGDGVNDGTEAIAGTNPNASLDYLRVADESMPDGASLVIRWPSASNRAYTIQQVTNIGDASASLSTNIPATPPLNIHTVPVDGAEQQFYFIEVEQP